MRQHGTAERRLAPARRRASKRLTLVLCAALGLAGLGGKCGGGDGSGGDPARVEIVSFDVRCAPLPDAFGFPPGWDFVPGVPGRVLAAVFAPPTLVPLDIDSVPFQSPADAEAFVLPTDSDGDGNGDALQAIDGVFGISSDLALVTMSGFESVLFVDPAGGLVDIVLETPDDFGEDSPRGWPDRGSANAVLRTGLQNFTCIAPPLCQELDCARDSRGELLVDVLDANRYCREGVPSYRSNFTSGVALAAGRLFVAVSNLGRDRNTDHTQFYPAAVTVYDIDFSVVPPRVKLSTGTPDGESFILSSQRVDDPATGDIEGPATPSFNATHTTAYTTPGGREFVLVSHTGAIGIPMDDPATRVIEGGATRITDGSVDVIDALRLRLVATIPLEGANPALNGLTIDPSGRVAMLGDITSRNLYAIDLAPLEDLPLVGEPGADEVQVLFDAVIFDGTPARSFVIPALPNGAPEATCPGGILGLDFSNDGEHVYAIDVCDGSFARIDVNLSGDPPFPVPSSRFTPPDQIEVRALTAPVGDLTLGRPRQPVELKVRPGVPGIDFSGPDVLFLVSESEGQLCGLNVE